MPMESAIVGMNPFLKAVALPYARLELPGWQRVMNRVAGHAHLADCPTVEMRGKLHGYRMTLQTADWCERWTFMLGRYYEAHTQMLFQKALRSGDVFVDIGANIGMTVLMAARCVGPTGRVMAFEPNPRVYQRLADHVDRNGLRSMVDPRNCALGDIATELELHVPLHPGQATFAPMAADSEGRETMSVKVPVRVGDDELAALPRGPLMIKIDTEGFECRVLAGLKRTLAERSPAVVCEAVPSLLSRAGGSIEALFAMMHDAGFVGHAVQHEGGLVGFASGTLRLLGVKDPAALAASGADDCLWLKPGGEHETRLRGMIV
ncbi:MAG: FkbM family methyltransferase [Phycisphaerales bacterium]